MHRQKTIGLLACAFFALQLALIAYWASLSGPDQIATDAAFAITATLVAGATDLMAVRYLFAALRRIESAFANDASVQLERSLASYREEALREERLSKQIGAAVEEELQEAHLALSQGRLEDLNEHLLQGLEAASQARAVRCDNVTVAAVLDSKARQCEEVGVGLDARVTLPRTLDLPDFEVAAIFFNLIDNALHECEDLLAEAREGEGLQATEAPTTPPPTITLRSKTQAGQLFLEVSNPRRAGQKKGLPQPQGSDPSRLHGWGTTIVSGLARHHGGVAEFLPGEQTFVARVMIPLAPANDQGASAS